MSRTGKKPIKVPEKVKVSIKDNTLTAEGPLGQESVEINPLAGLEIKDNVIHISRKNDDKHTRCVHGMTRALVANVVNGVSTGFTKDLEINGVGYRAEVKGKVLNLTLGFSHVVNYEIPTGIKITAKDQTKLSITGSNKELVGRVASQIRGYRPPEPYKGKGVKYSDEHIIRKVGKAAGGK